MIHPRVHLQHDESLQTDVMRFMAIIAFCLIAILALVRNVEETTPIPTPSVQKVRVTSVQPDVVNPPAQVLQPSPPVPEQTPMIVPAPVMNERQVAQVLETPPIEEQGLSLRFASDRDFLRLLTRDSIDLYAFNDNQVLVLAEQYNFVAAAAPGQLYELMPGTIPALLTASLQADAMGMEYHWGIRIPQAMERKIRRYVNDAATGELIIDRFGEVHHVPAS